MLVRSRTVSIMYSGCLDTVSRMTVSKKEGPLSLSVRMGVGSAGALGEVTLDARPAGAISLSRSGGEEPKSNRRCTGPGREKEVGLTVAVGLAAGAEVGLEERREGCGGSRWRGKGVISPLAIVSLAVAAGRCRIRLMRRHPSVRFLLAYVIPTISD